MTVESPANHQVPPGWITEFVPPSGDEPVLCRGWHEATHQQWFVAVYVHKMIDGYWVMRHDGSEPEFVIAWTPIPGYPYSKSFNERLRSRGYPMYPYLVKSADGMAIEARGIGYSVVSFGPPDTLARSEGALRVAYTGDSLRSTAAENNTMASRQRICDEEVAAMQKDGRLEAK